MVWQRNLLGSRRRTAARNLTADGALRLAWAAWDRSLLPCLSAPELHAHLRGERAEGRKEQERVFICDADEHVLAMTIKTLQIHPRINNLALSHHIRRVKTVVNPQRKYISNNQRT